MGLFDFLKKDGSKEENNEQLLQFFYEEDELNELDRFICEKFGEYKSVFHEMASPDVHLDVCIIDPTQMRFSTDLTKKEFSTECWI